MNKLSYKQFSTIMKEHNVKTNSDYKQEIKGVIVFTPDSFTKEYPLESRSYEVSSYNKAWKPDALGYSIYGNSLDGTDIGVRLESYMQLERGGKDGWKVDYCYML